MVIPALVDINPAELKYYPFMTSLNKCIGSCNVISPKVFVPKETKYIYIKAFTVITNNDEVKAMRENVLCSTVVQHVIHVKNEIIKHVIVNVKIIVNAKKVIIGILSHVFVRIVSI